MPEEKYGWLIEANMTYWDGRACTPNSFVSDVNEAVRFVRLEDAERVRLWLLEEWAFALRSTEHAWI